MRLLTAFLVFMSFEAFITSGNYIQSGGNIARYVSKFDELFVLTMLLISAYFLTRGHLKKYKYVLISISSLFVIIIISSIVNAVKITTILEFMLRYGKIPIIILYVLIKNIDKNQLYMVLRKYIVLLATLQFFINLLWAVGIKIIPNIRIDSPDDWAIGTLGNTLLVAFVGMIAISTLLYENYYHKIPRWKKYLNLLIIILLIIQIYWSRSHHLTVIGIAVFSVIGFMNILSTRKKIITILFISMVISGVGIRYIMSSSYVNISHQIDRLSLSPKWISTYESIFLLPSTSPYVIFGVGPGQGGSFIAKENPTSITQNLFLPYESAKIRKGSIITLTFTGINTIASELGLVGLLWYLLTVALLSLHLFKTEESTGGGLAISKNITIVTIINIFFLESIMIDLFQHTIIPVILACYIVCVVKSNPISLNQRVSNVVENDFQTG